MSATLLSEYGMVWYGTCSDDDAGAAAEAERDVDARQQVLAGARRRRRRHGLHGPRGVRPGAAAEVHPQPGPACSALLLGTA